MTECLRNSSGEDWFAWAKGLGDFYPRPSGYDASEPVCGKAGHCSEEQVLEKQTHLRADRKESEEWTWDKAEFSRRHSQ